MGKKVGVFFLLLGTLCILFAAGLLIYNHLEASQAGEASDALLQEVQENTGVSYIENDGLQKMAALQVEGYDCVGVLSIPVLELSLPVLSDWSYAKLKIAPCVYYGTYNEPNFVIAAHNYRSHFAKLSMLQPKDLILFTDISGTAHYYEVVLLETLPGHATEDMITSGFDLSLYTCTSAGGSRVTVRCTLLSESQLTFETTDS